ncbi:hypothetical protein [Escherichia coli]|uniref:hypothetical protein n=1 Tax=Escherichia coli TaxID=562 RepID=UPI00388E064D
MTLGDFAYPADIKSFQAVARLWLINTMTTSLNHGYRGAVIGVYCGKASDRTGDSYCAGWRGVGDAYFSRSVIAV